VWYRVLRYGAVWCGVVNVMQCVAVCCSVLQCVAVWYRVLRYGAVWCGLVQCVAVWRSVLRSGAVWCGVANVMQCVAMQCGV